MTQCRIEYFNGNKTMVFRVKPIACSEIGTPKYSVKFKINLSLLANSSAKIIELKRTIDEAKTIRWSEVEHVLPKQIHWLFKRKYLFNEISKVEELGSRYFDIDVKWNASKIQLFSINTFDDFYKLLQFRDRSFYHVLSQMVALFTSSKFTSLQFQDTSQKQIELVFKFLNSSDQKLILGDLEPEPDPESIIFAEEVSGNSLFALALRECYPWAAAMRHQLKDLNVQLQEDAPYYVPLKGEDDSGILLDKTLNDLLPLHKRILIFGSAGSGKSLFVRTYVHNLLSNWTLGQPLPFYIPLCEIKNPKNGIVQEFMEKYQLADCIKDLKKIPTIWFLDGYHDLIVKDRSNLFNIFESNDFMDWPLAHFVFTCRREILEVGEEKYFVPEGEKRIKLVFINCPKKHIKLLLNTYTNKNQRWTKKEYKLEFKNLELKEMFKNFYNLKFALDKLPDLDLSSDKKKSFLNLWLCDLFKREFENKTDPINAKRWLSDCLNFILEVSLLMETCKYYFVSNVWTDVLKDTATQKSLVARRYETKIKEAKEILSKTRQNEVRTHARIKELESQIKEYELSIQQVNTAPRKLYEYLFDKKYALFRTEELLKDNKIGKRGFTYSLVYKHLIHLNRDDTLLQALRDQLNK